MHVHIGLKFGPLGFCIHTLYVWIFKKNGAFWMVMQSCLTPTCT